MTFVADLEPRLLWKHFDRILTIPRGSKNEEAMAHYVVSLAQKHGLSHKQDATGNIVVRKEGRKGRENAPITILQSHLDMVNEKNADVEHDFSKDPIKPRRENGYLMATGTTLGSDNGIGVATSLALMEDETLQHGPLELLFTVDEETGLTGSAGLEPDFLEGRRLINLDTEEEGAFYVGCAGGAGVNVFLPLQFISAPAGLTTYRIKLFGMRGGHSGVDIHLQRGNAIKLLARALEGLLEPFDFQLAELAGGNMHNAIPREAFAVLSVPEVSQNTFKRKLENEQFAAIQKEYAPAEPDLQWSIQRVDPAERIFDKTTTSTVLALLNAIHHGVVSMSYDIPELVETSANLATVKIEAEELVLHVSNRSSVHSALKAAQKRIGALARLAGARAEYGEGYPGWKPDLDSHLLAVGRQVFVQKNGKDPIIKAVHAGLECGIIGEKYRGMDMLSLGPQIEFPHSPDERLLIDSVAEYFDLLSAILEKLAEEQNLPTGSEN